MQTISNAKNYEYVAEARINSIYNFSRFKHEILPYTSHT